MTGVINGARKGAMALGPKEALLRAQREANAAVAEKSSRGTAGKADPQGGRAAQPQNGARYGDGAGVATGPREKKSGGYASGSSSGAVNAVLKRDEGSNPSPPTKPKRGRPRIEDRDKPKPPKPWETAGMSRRSWYRRKAEAKQEPKK